MKNLKKIIVGILFIINFFGYSFVYAEGSCNPAEVKPPYEGTGIGKISISPDIVAVGGLMTIMIRVENGVSDLNIDIPVSSELTDYYPKNSTSKITVTATNRLVDWRGELPAGDYSITVKVNHWTEGKWTKTGYSATVYAGVGPGASYYYAYYNTIPLDISLEDRNQSPQSTKDVVRKVNVKGVRDLKLTLQTNSGEIGTSISEKNGNSATLKANQDGTATFFLFTEEGKNIKLTATSPDTCMPSTKETSFKIKRSDVARTYIDNSWIWWLGGALIVIIIIVSIIVIRKKKNKAQVNYQTTASSAQSRSMSQTNNIPIVDENNFQKTNEQIQNDNNIRKDNL